MKLCPQCAFIYEDVQKVCDMDGEELVAAPGPAVTQPASLPDRLTENLPPKTRSKRIPLLAIVGLVLATLIAAFFLVQLNWRSRPGPIADETQIDMGVPPISLPTTSDFQAPVISPASDQSPLTNGSTEELTDDSASSEPELSHSRSGPLSASRLRSISSGSSGSSRNSVLIHLTNGGIVRADEAWERRDGVWYKQGGVITLLPRSSVKSIERPAGSSQPSTNSTQRNHDVIAQNQPRPARTEAVTVKKESRVGSFLKKTGRILKKPFKF